MCFMANKKGYAFTENKVLKAIPCWHQWTRQLRRIYLSLPAFGSSEAAIEEICDELGFNYEKVCQKIISTPSFKRFLDMYRKEKDYPKVNDRDDGKYEHRVKHEEIKKVYGQYSDIIKYFHMEDLKAQNKGADFAMRVIEQRNLVEMNIPDVDEEKVKSNGSGVVKLFETS